MTPEQFCYWLHGYVEIHGHQPTGDEWQVIKDHLDLVFTKVTPVRKAPLPRDAEKKILSEQEKSPQKRLQELLDDAREGYPTPRIDPYCMPGKIC